MELVARRVAIRRYGAAPDRAGLSVASFNFADSAIHERALAMQMPCSQIHSAWQLLRFQDYAVICVACGAPGEIRTPDPQIRSLALLFQPGDERTRRKP
jgi:hypothetical protein